MFLLLNCIHEKMRVLYLLVFPANNVFIIKLYTWKNACFISKFPVFKINLHSKPQYKLNKTLMTLSKS